MRKIDEHYHTRISLVLGHISKENEGIYAYQCNIAIT